MTKSKILWGFFVGASLALTLVGIQPDLQQVEAAGIGCPSFVYGLVPTAAQWQACFDAKQAALGYVPVNKAGDRMTGKLTLPAPAVGGAGFNLPAGTAPTVPVDGDLWATTSGIFARTNGATVGPLSSIPVYNTSGTAQAAMHGVVGSVTLSGGSGAVSLTGASVFTSNATYRCSLTDTGGVVAAVAITLTSGSAFTAKGTGTDVLTYFCIGN